MITPYNLFYECHTLEEHNEVHKGQVCFVDFYGDEDTSRIQILVVGASRQRAWARVEQALGLDRSMEV